MKKLLTILGATGLALTVQAQSLHFVYGSVTNTTAYLLLSGQTNLACSVERYNPTNLTWQSVGQITLDNYGYALFSASLWNSDYGLYRACSTNGYFFTTNAYAYTAGTLGYGRAFVGNPFYSTSIESILVEPAEGTTVYKWNNASNSFEMAYYDLEWLGAFSVGPCEGFYVDTPTNCFNRFVFSTLFSTNIQTLTIPQGSSMLCVPQVTTIVTNAWTVDRLTTNALGGISQLPVQTLWVNPQSTINKMIDGYGNFDTYTLSTNNMWLLDGYPTEVLLGLNEGFWLYKPTNATWYIQRSIW